MSSKDSDSDSLVVWVKYGKSLWPAEKAEEYPEDTTARCRKPPLFVVKFFDEDFYEAVTSEGQYKPYNVENKNDLIKKGLKTYINTVKEPEKSEKFKRDVLRAEGLKDSDQNEKDNFFEKITKEEKAGNAGSKLNYKEIFTEKKPQVNSPIIIPTAPPTHKVKPKAATPGAKKLKKGQSSVVDGKRYNCDQCNYTTDRLNVITMHAKTHSSVTPPAQIPKPMSPTSLSPSKTYVHSDTPISGKRIGTGNARFSSTTTTSKAVATLKASQTEPSKTIASSKPLTTPPPSQSKKRGRKSKETLRLEKELEEKAKLKKEDILAEWSGDEAETKTVEKEKNAEALDEEDDEEIESEEPKEKRPKQKNFDDIFNKLLFAKHGSTVGETSSETVGETAGESENDQKIDISESDDKNTIEEKEKIVSDDVVVEKDEEKEKNEEKEDDLMNQIEEFYNKDSTNVLDKINKSLENKTLESNPKPIIIPDIFLNNSMSVSDDDQEMEEILEKGDAEKEIIKEDTSERELNTPSPTKSSTEPIVLQLTTTTSLKSTISEAPVLAVKSLPQQQVEHPNLSTPKTYKIIKPITSIPTTFPACSKPPIIIPPSSQQPTKSVHSPATAATASSLVQQKQKQIGVVRPNSTSPVHAANSNVQQQQFTSTNQINDLKKPNIQNAIVTTHTQAIPSHANLQQIISNMQQQQQQQNQFQSSNIITNPSPMRTLAKSGGLTPAEQIVHLVPVENADGTVTYMLLSLNQEGLLLAETEGNQPLMNSAAAIESNQQGIPVSNLENLSSIYIDTKEGTDVDTLIRQIEAGRACSTTTNSNNQIQQNATNTTSLINQQQQQQFSITLDNSNIVNQQQQPQPQQQQQPNQELVIQLAEDGSLISDQLFDIDSLQIFNPQ